MNQSLYLFVTSERPDQYINSIVHCLLYKSIKKIVFLHIRGFGTEASAASDSNRKKSLAVFLHVQNLLDALSRGFYIFFVDKRAGEKVDLRNIYPKEKMIALKSTYKQCLDREVDWDSRDINYLELRGELARIRKNAPDSIFDVTAIKKSFIGDIIACCLLERIHNVYTFDLEYTPHPTSTSHGRCYFMSLGAIL